MFDRTRIPVVLLTGHLGSGKTTLLNQYLSSGDSSRTAVIINEFGQVALDHQLVRQTTENIVLLENGCICCTVRDDLVKTLKDLLAQAKAGRIPGFDRVVIETTGLADPVPVVHSMMNDLQIMLSYQLSGVVTLVDSVLGGSVIRDHAEAGKQVALADCLVLTKTDLARPEDRRALEIQLSLINPSARIETKGAGGVDPALFEARLFEPGAASDIEHWLARTTRAGGATSAHGSTTVRNFCVIRDDPLDWDAVSDWVEGLVTECGPKLLRVKGLLNVGDPLDRPHVLHGIQHLFHPPEPLDAWPSEDRRTRVVFIVDGIEQADVEARLDAACARPAVA